MDELHRKYVLFNMKWHVDGQTTRVVCPPNPFVVDRSGWKAKRRVWTETNPELDDRSSSVSSSA